MRIIAFGSRHWQDYDRILRVLSAYAVEFRVWQDPGVTLVHGAARGADEMAGRAAKEIGWRVEEHPADWNQFGRSAGHRRNKHMAELGASRAFGFPRGVTPGTFNMIEHCVRCGIPTQLFPDKPVNDGGKRKPTP